MSLSARVQKNSPPLARWSHHAGREGDRMTRLEVLSDQKISCDTCDAPLGPITYVRQDIEGVFCSEDCRDGEEEVSVSVDRRDRRGAIPANINQTAAKKRARAEHHRTVRLRRKK
jgi:hypothetical protein